MTKILSNLFTFILTCSFVQSIAQGPTTASLHGNVGTFNAADSSQKEIIEGITIKATHLPSGTYYTTSTNSKGKFNIQGMRIGGPYQIEAFLLGYKSQPKTIGSLALGDNYETYLTMVQASTELDEVVVKNNTNDWMNTDKIGTATNINKTQLEQLPSIGRSIVDFTSLSPQSGPNFNFAGRNELYNNFAIDGATSGNLFGLSALPGGQSGANPISLDAIQEIKITIAPFDVRQGNFTGAAINAVTRSGTNEFSGSVYRFMRNQNMTGSKISGIEQSVKSFNFQNTGFRLGGPIIKNRLFFFTNFENEANTEPASVFVANNGINQGNNVSSVKQSDLDGLASFLKNNYGYDPGIYQNWDRDASVSNKFLFKLDFNISDKHKLSVKYNFLEAHQDVPPNSSGGAGSGPSGGRGAASATYMPFQSTYYRINNKMHSVIAELNSTFNQTFANNLQIGYTAMRDNRASFSGGIANNISFPLVDIYNGNGSNMTSFGYEPFTYKNTLKQDIYQVSNNLTIYKGNHIATVGASAEFVSCYNLFWPQRNPVYQYNSLQDFYDDANGVAGKGPSQFIYQYSAVSGEPSYSFSSQMLGFYAQNEYVGFKNIKFTGGLRLDVPIITAALSSNPIVDKLSFNNGEKIDLANLPKTSPLFSPRFGFNWDVFGNKSTQIRGGSGLFSGRVPLYWIGNQAANNGLLFGQINVSGSAAANYHFNPNPDAYIPANATTPPTFGIISVVKDFKFLQVWRSNIAIDQKLGHGLIGTLEFLYTKDINSVFYRNANQVDPSVNSNVNNDGRPLYPAGALDRNINQAVAQALILDNTNQGYQWSFTAQVQKKYENGFMGSIAYTFTQAKDVNNSGTTIFVGNLNTPTLGNSNSLVPHRLVANCTYRKQYFKHFASTFSIVYQAYNYTNVGGNNTSVYSTTYGGDPVYSGFQNNNSLIYIPKNKDEILLVPTNAADTRTPDQIWSQLDAYINQDSYLSNHRGQFADRNGSVAPIFHSLNFRFLQDFSFKVGKSAEINEKGSSYKGKINNLQFSFELVNVLNFLNSNWGVLQQTYTNQPLNFIGYENNPIINPNGSVASAPSGRPIYTFPTVQYPTNANAQVPLSTTYRDYIGLESRYQIQLGIRYSFN